MSTPKARLDSDGTAQPKTRLIGHAKAGDRIGPGLVEADALEDTKTGERIPLAPRFVGYHDDHEIPVKKGDRVTVRKGTKIRTMMPSMNGGYQSKVAGRTYKVTVDHILNGMNRPVGHPGHNASYPVQPPSVRWPGTGGYWFEVDLNDIPEAQGSASV